MELKEGIKNELLKILLDPQLISEEEAAQFLKEDEIDINAIEEKFNRFEKKLKAELELESGRIKKALFEEKLEVWKKDSLSDKREEHESGFRLAARNKEGVSPGDIQSDNNDIKLMEYLKKK